MKKFLAVIISLVMMFSLCALPAAAAQEEANTEETITLNDVFETIELTVELIEDTINKVHYIVGTILGMLSKECPMCAEVHQIEASEEEVPGEELPEDSEELPEDIAALLAA